MSQNTPPQPEDRSAPSGRSRPGGWYVALPAVALVVGLVLGGLVVGLSMSGDSGGDDEDTAGGQSTTSAQPTAVASDTLVIPAACAQAADSVRDAASLLNDGVAAIRNFQRKKIVDLLNQLEDLSRQAQEQAQTCSASGVTTAPAATATASSSTSEGTG